MNPAIHDEVKAWIDDKLKQIEEASSVYGALTGDGYRYRASLLANRAGLEMKEAHSDKPENYAFDIESYCDGYNSCLKDLQKNIANPIRSVM